MDDELLVLGCTVGEAFATVEVQFTRGLSMEEREDFIAFVADEYARRAEKSSTLRIAGDLEAWSDHTSEEDTREFLRTTAEKIRSTLGG